MKDILKDICILDFSHRLPGPFAGMLLAELGAKVFKVEDSHHKDAFLSGFFKNLDSSFQDWYDNLNQKKSLLRFDFRDPKNQGRLEELIKICDGIIMGLPPKVQKQLNLDEENIKRLNNQCAIIYMGASRKGTQNMHDMNAMADTGILSLYTHEKNEEILAPPFMPLAGIGFGQQIALQLIAAALKAKLHQRLFSTTCYIYETTDMLFSPFWSQKLREEKRTKFFHNGAYPCYCLYRTKDGNYLGVAASEEKFWDEFAKLFQVRLQPEDRFKTDPEVFEAVSQAIKNKSSDEIREMIKGKEICLSLVESVPS